MICLQIIIDIYQIQKNYKFDLWAKSAENMSQKAAHEQAFTTRGPGILFRHHPA
jgi:hypothetical protein